MRQTEAFRILASADRQLVLYELLEQDGASTVEDLARHVAARRHRISPERLRDEQVERAQARLVHTHFPQLLELGIVDIDWETRTVSLTDDECVTTLFEAAAELDGWPPTDLLNRTSLHGER